MRWSHVHSFAVLWLLLCFNHRSKQLAQTKTFSPQSPRHLPGLWGPWPPSALKHLFGYLDNKAFLTVTAMCSCHGQYLFVLSYFGLWILPFCVYYSYYISLHILNTYICCLALYLSNKAEWMDNRQFNLSMPPNVIFHLIFFSLFRHFLSLV